MALVYLVPASEPIPDPGCAPCGSFVRRGVPWHLSPSESSGGDHTIRILQQEKQGFTLTDKHVYYLESAGVSCPSVSTFIMSTLDFRPFLLADSVIVRFFADITLSQDFFDNYEDYIFKLDGNTADPYVNLSDEPFWGYYPVDINDQSELYLQNNDWGENNWTYKNYFYFNHASSLDTVVHTIEIIHLGVPRSSVTLTFTRLTPGNPNSEVSVVMSDIVGPDFGQVSDDEYSQETFTCG